MINNKEKEIIEFVKILNNIKKLDRVWFQANKPGLCDMKDKVDSFLSVVWQGYYLNGESHLCDVDDERIGYLLFYDSGDTYFIDYAEDGKIIYHFEFLSLGSGVRFINEKLDIKYDHGMRKNKISDKYPNEISELNRKYRTCLTLGEMYRKSDKIYRSAFNEYVDNNGLEVGTEVEILETGETGFITSRSARADSKFTMIYDVSRIFGDNSMTARIGYRLRESELDVINDSNIDEGRP